MITTPIFMDHIEEAELTIDITIFQRNKGMIIMLLIFCISGGIGVATPFIFGGTQPIIFFAAILFFAIPVISFPFVKKNILKKAFLICKKSGLRLQEINKENSKAINWDEIEHYRVTPFDNLSGTGFVLKLNYRKKGSFKVAIIDKNLWAFINNNKNDALLSTICYYINYYNQLQTDQEEKIALLPSIFASKSGIYLLWIPVILLIIDIGYRFSHPIALKKNILFFFSVAFFTLFFLGQKRKDKDFFKALLKLHNAEV